MKKLFQELTLIDPFMFTAVMSNPEQCRALLEVILERKILKVTIITEKTIQYRPDYHGVRLDVLAIEDGSNRHYNVEMQVKDHRNLARRSRYYHSQMDMEMLMTSKDYSQLPDTYVIFICAYDPIGEGLYRYTFSSCCLETGEQLGDGKHTIWLNTKGTNRHGVSTLLVSFLDYVDDPATVSDDEYGFIQGIEESVKNIKQNRRWEDAYMQFQEMLAEERAEGKAEGFSKAILIILQKYGDIPDSLQHTINAETDLGTLTCWLKNASTACSLEEFCEFIKNSK
ncbi:MAG: Rpn family recombination-promoting nuclease/putative transposase [Clostridia bacterium]|nr:Rpn family recombination-promoting nuclease/putative transposase [Lachnospiraceae bacterium]NCC00221.1 Rpn family recombination-promoting nuclease/putative transposase [Clostridia bacterium]NCD03650.1 Rpn family recombination-promoting nuclease/putative transposase [Clostridia bacterium]